MRDKTLKYTIIIALLITAMSNAQHKIDTKLKPYVNEYFKMLDNNNIAYDITLMIVTTSERLEITEYLGIALGTDNNDLVYIRISPKFFDLDTHARLWVMFHELSHDIFNLRHGSIRIMSKKLPYYVDSSMLSKASNELVGYLKGL